jgi:hypothetical protein
MILDNISTDRIMRNVQALGVIGLALDRHANGKIIAAEVCKDETRITLGEMTTDDFYRLAQRLNLPVLPSHVATAQEKESHRLAMRRQSERAEEAREMRGVRETPAWAVPDKA